MGLARSGDEPLELARQSKKADWVGEQYMLRGRTLWHMGRFEDAQADLVEASKRPGPGGRKGRAAMPRVLRDWAQLLWDRRSEEALEIYARAEQAARDAGRMAFAIDIRSRRASILVLLGRPGRAEKLMQQVRVEFAKPSRERGIVEQHWSRLLGDLGRFEEALAAIERARAIFGEHGNSFDKFSLMEEEGSIRLAMGDDEQALQLIDRAIKESAAAGVPPSAGRLGNLGIALGHNGRLAAALEIFDRALAMARKPRVRFMVLGNRLMIQRVLNNPALAEQDASEMVRIAREQGFSGRWLAGALNAHAGALGRMGRHADSEQRYREGLEAARNSPGGGGVATYDSLNGIGSTYLLRGRFEEARHWFAEALEVEEHASAHYLLARCLARLGRLDEAAVHARRAQELGGDRDRVKVEHALADVALRRGELQEAMRHVRRGIEAAAVYGSGLAEESTARWREYSSELFEVGMAAAVRAEDPEGLFFVLEAGRARGLAEAFGRSGQVRQAVLPDALRRELASADRRLEIARAAYAEARRLRKRQRIRAARQRLETEQRTREEVVARARRASKAAAGLVYPQPATLASVQAVLRDDEALVLFGITDEFGAAALVATRGAARMVRLGQRPDCHFEPKQGLDAASLRKALVEPLGLEARRILVSPHRETFLLPFAQLMPDKELVYVPSGTVLLSMREATSKARRGVLALGDPDYSASRLAALPATREEAKAIGDTVLLGKEANRKRLVEAIQEQPKGWRAVHVACHGLIDTAHPMRSALALSDGPLPVLDLFRLEVPADLVVLSACETARGKVFKAEGVVGFVQAFVLAGASRVIVSLWKVDDEATRALMVKFYELWKGGASAASALRQAQQHVAAQPKWKHPCYWAAWQLWGLP